MAITAYDTRTLFGKVELIRRPKSFLLDTLFPTIQEFETETIDFDIIEGGRELAPFVRPDVPGKPIRTGGYQTKSFRPAYVKPKETIKPGRAMKRRAGEPYNGAMSNAARLEALTLDTLDEQRKSIILRKEWMAAQALDAGQVTVTGEDYPTQIVDFTRDPALTVALTGSAAWGSAGVKVLDSIEDNAAIVQEKSGSAPSIVIMDPFAWKLARADQDFFNLLDNRRQATGQMELGPVALSDETGARYAGSVGDFDFYIYQQTYKVDGVPTKMIPDNTVFLSGPALQGVQAHGAIQDTKLGLVALEYAPKVWDEDDPSARVAMTQSAPLVVPANVNHSMRIRVA